MNGTTSVPKSVPHLVLDKVRLLSVSESFLQCSYSRKVPNKSLSHELNSVFIRMHYCLEWIDYRHGPVHFRLLHYLCLVCLPGMLGILLLLVVHIDQLLI